MTYEKCCKPFHEGTPPATALQLMRSRYAAYALDKPDYIVKTTHRANPHYSEDIATWKKEISQFSKGTQFNRLEIHDFKEDRTTATVTFTAHLTQSHHDATFTEKSAFEKVGDWWMYRSGEILNRV